VVLSPGSIRERDDFELFSEPKLEYILPKTHPKSFFDTKIVSAKKFEEFVFDPDFWYGGTLGVYKSHDRVELPI
jgi:hypothetical protein